MAYNQNIPQATDQISQSQAQILANFQALNGIAANTLPYLLMGPVQASAPTTSATQMALYTKTSANTATQEMFLRRLSNGAETELTAKAVNAAVSNMASGWTILPAGLLVKWGSQAANAASVTVTPTALSGGPAFSVQPYIAFAMPFDTALTNFTCGVKAASTTTNGNFEAYCANFTANTRILYLVIGPI